MGLAHPAHAGRMQQPGGGTEGGAANRHGSGTWHPLPGPSFPQAQGQAKGRERQPQKSLGWTLKPSWTPPHLLFAPVGQESLVNFMSGVPKPYSLQPSKKASPPRALRPSYLFPQLIRSPLSPPLGHQVPRLGHARRAFGPAPLSSFQPGLCPILPLLPHVTARALPETHIYPVIFPCHFLCPEIVMENSE